MPYLSGDLRQWSEGALSVEKQKGVVNNDESLIIQTKLLVILSKI